MNHRIGVCSWSLQPETVEDLARKVEAAGVSAVQLALDPLRTGAWPGSHAAAMLREAGIDIRSGMMAMGGEDYATLESIRRTGGVRPDEHWSANLAAADQTAQLARELGIGLVSFHAGFLPHGRGGRLWGLMLGRLRAIIDRFSGCGVRVALETGQEEAQTLLDVLDELDRPETGVNFDPANMVLYGMGDPVEALRTLARRVLQIHVKDAVATQTPGTWGSEVVVGTGDVDWQAFFGVVQDAGLSCDLMIEREAGGDRVADIRRARELVARFVS